MERIPSDAIFAEDPNFQEHARVQSIEPSSNLVDDENYYHEGSAV